MEKIALRAPGFQSCLIDRDPSVNLERFLKYPTEGDLDSDQRETDLPKKPSFLARLIPGLNNRYHASVAAAMANLRATAEEHNRSVKAAETALTNNDPEAIGNYFELVLSTSEYPSKFPRRARVAFIPASRQLAFDYQLPIIEDIIPNVEKYK
jgi:restriction system protein